MKLAPWYKIVLLIWLCVGFPGLMLAYGFSDGKVGDWFTFEDQYPSDIIVQLAVWLLLVSPFWLAPIGLRRQVKSKSTKSAES